MNKKYWLKCPALSVELKKRKSKKFYFTWVLGFPKKSANLVPPFGQLYIHIYVDIFKIHQLDCPTLPKFILLFTISVTLVIYTRLVFSRSAWRCPWNFTNLRCFKPQGSLETFHRIWSDRLTSSGEHIPEYSFIKCIA